MHPFVVPAYRRPGVILLTAVIVISLVIIWVMRDQNPLRGEQLYAPQNTQAARHASDPGLTQEQSEALQRLATQPSAEWFAFDTPRNAEQRARTLAIDAAAAGQVPVGVIYNLPYRDCGGDSASSLTPDEYREYVLAVVRGFRAVEDQRIVLIYEPDAVAQITGLHACLTEQQSQERLVLMNETVRAIKSKLPRSLVYVDAGHSDWFPDPSLLVQPLRDGGAEYADGLSVNVSNFQTTEDSVEYGRQLGKLLGVKHFVIDTSRNGAGPYIGTGNDTLDPPWCNPPGIKPGPAPTTDTHVKGVDAFLYIKRLGESDGACRPGEPKAGEWMMEHTLKALGVA